MTTRRTVHGLSRLLVLVPVTVCVTISYASEDAHRCYDRRTPPPQTLASCHYDSECTNNAYCWNQRACFCKDDYIVYRHRSNVQCLKVAAEIGDKCIVDLQCHMTFTPDSECRNNSCQCSPGTRFKDGRCYKSVGLGHSCQTHHNCYVNDSYCVDGFCACTLQHHGNPSGSECVKNSYLGDNCTHDYDCVSEDSRCIGTCSCKVDYILSKDRQRCLKAANSVGEYCEEDSQCNEFLKYTKCDQDGICNCINNYHRRGSICLKNVGLGSQCVSHQECVTETYKDSSSIEILKVNCINEICTCANDYTMSEDGHDCIRYSLNGVRKQDINCIISLIIVMAFYIWIFQ